MFFPYKDDNPTLRRPVVTVLFIVANALTWLLIQGLGTEPSLTASVCELGLVPGEVLGRLPPGTPVRMGHFPCVTGSPMAWVTPVTSMFLHGGWFHLIGNMWFLWVFGNNVEDSMGHIRFGLFYLLTGLAAAAAQAATNPASAVPMVGASGAISGVMGAYIVLFPKVRVHVLVFLAFFITRTAVPAVVMLAFWFLLQLLGGIPGLAQESGGIAFWAHAGGFVGGIIAVFLFRNPRLIRERMAHNLPT